MDSSLQELWHTASGSPFVPTIGKDNQFFVGFSFLLLALSLSGAFLLNRSFANLFRFGISASIAFALGIVYMFCAVGVYV